MSIPDLISKIVYGGMALLLLYMMGDILFHIIVSQAYMLFPMIFKLPESEEETEGDGISYMEKSLDDGWEYLNDDSRYERDDF